MSYDHTQRGRFHTFFLLLAAVFLYAAWRVRSEPLASLTLLGAGLAVLFLSFSFMRLTVRDAGDHLLIRFGPLPLLRKKIPYEEISEAEEGRSSWIDGWGIHWVPWRGWIYNIWGFSCVKLTLLGDRMARVGTDDAANLERFLRQKTGEGPRKTEGVAAGHVEDSSKQARRKLG